MNHTESTSEAVTRGIRVQVRARYSPDHSNPERSAWFFLYTIRIRNEGPETVQLRTRYWLITDGTGHREEVRGPGVVGEEPILAPGDEFEYTSGCPLPTPFGTMEGSYRMEVGRDEAFDVRVERFELKQSTSLH